MDAGNFVKGYLTFSKKERVGIILVLLLAVIIIFLPKFFKKKQSPTSIINHTLLVSAVDTLQERAAKNPKRFSNDDFDGGYPQSASKYSDYTKGELFEFDPNTISLDEWKRLGLSDKNIKTINNYRTKGGKFYKKEDVQKIWGLPSGFYERVQDYIQINLPQRENHFQNNYAPGPKYEKKEHIISEVNVNGADTAAFIELPGIGSKLAFRITAFRDKLGGFYSVDQIKETYGLSDSTFQIIKPYLKVDATAIKKININTATKDELKLHPYIRWNLANVIVEYRTQHGRFNALTDIKNIAIIDEVTFAKIAPYLTLQ
ncbi:MAG: helix-hairpin-helix domain-containing protein [Chitinophagaceae bacterium]